VPVWSHDGILCVADILKNAVRLTFPKGTQISDHSHIFNTRLDSKSVRAVDVFEDTQIDEPNLMAIISEAATLNDRAKPTP